MVENGNGNSEERFLPQDLLINILKRVPVKFLIRFKCVCKDWAKLLESPYFSEQQLHHSSHNNPFLVLQRMSFPSLFFFSFLPEPDFRAHDIDLTTLRTAQIVASCNGLLCLKHLGHTFSLFNPATRQIKQLPQTLTDIKPIYNPGFGFSPLVNDHKIVEISANALWVNNRAQVYSLTTGYWKEIDAVNFPPLSLVHRPVTANGAIFWLATMNSDPDSYLVVSFDIGLEVFTLLKGPSPSPSPSPHYSHSSVLAVYYDKLAMFRRFVDGKLDLWVLEDAPTGTVSEENWIKMYSVSLAGMRLYPVSIWRDEIVCLQVGRFSGQLQYVPFIFNPYTSELKKLLPSDIHWYSCTSFNYVESLVTVFSVEEVKNKN